MKQYPNFAIVVSFFGLWITSFFSSENQVFMGFVFILTFGILHGANDLLILQNLLTEKGAISFSKMLLYYIILVLVGGLLFFLIPLVVLLFFILISGYHFGEQQIHYLEKNISPIFKKMFQLLYGLLILFLLFSFHQLEVQTIVSEITSFLVPLPYISYSLYFILIFFGILFLYIYTKFSSVKQKLILELFYLVVFGILFKVASLIWGFAIYFILWHSIPSIIDQVKFLFGDFTKNSAIAYLKSAVLYWIVSLLGLVIFYFVFNEVKLFNSMFFSFLAAITFPHVLVILKMFEKTV